MDGSDFCDDAVGNSDVGTVPEVDFCVLDQQLTPTDAESATNGQRDFPEEVRQRVPRTLTRCRGRRLELEYDEPMRRK
jgi:hypothetical protein